MGIYEDLSAGSEFHRVKRNKGSIGISPIDNSREALERFQPVAHKAIEHEHEGYTLDPRPHYSSMHPGRLYDMLALVQTPE